MPPRKPPARDPAFIGTSTQLEPVGSDAAAGQRELTAELLAQNEALRAENESLKWRKTYDEVRAEMMQPYAGKVFNFLVCYCLFVGAIILLAGFKLGGFVISDTVLGIIAGSTAASAIGLVGFVVSGLFGAVRAAGKSRR
ncbi:MAG TPA: hypothetical protein VN113_10185 [Caulobacter sp.]|nr:hypothetical protein [Caulobacter sp.]